MVRPSRGRPEWYYGNHPPACTCVDCAGARRGGNNRQQGGGRSGQPRGRPADDTTPISPSSRGAPHREAPPNPARSGGSADGSSGGGTRRHPPSNQPPNSNGSGAFGKILLAVLVAALIGGGAVYGAMLYVGSDDDQSATFKRRQQYQRHRRRRPLPQPPHPCQRWLLLRLLPARWSRRKLPYPLRRPPPSPKLLQLPPHSRRRKGKWW